jgi:beta-glucanase (GH16 family)
VIYLDLKPSQMKFLFNLLAILFIIHSSFAQCPKLVWADEFDGNTLNSSNWSHQIGDACDMGFCGWGNNELQYYREQNTSVKDGILTISARREAFASRQYTSSRIRTKNKISVKYGRIESRMKMPIGKGIWPALWMLPENDVYGGWPKSGEIDIMEYLGHEPNKIHGTLHYGQDSPNNRNTSQSFTTNGPGFNEDYHIYAMEWNPTSIKWFIDGYLYSTKTTADLGGSFWPFIEKFHFLINCAVGGNWPGNPDGNTVFPQEFKVDYVRVFDLTDQPYLSGNLSVDQGSTQTYTINKPQANSTYTWTIPSDAKITAGAGTNAITVLWGNNSGKVSVEIKNTCSTSTQYVDVKSEAPLVGGLVFENFDTPGRITRVFQNGTFVDDFPNPAKTAANNSNLVGQYKRNGSNQYDVLVYDVKDIKNAAEYINGQKVFGIDIYTAAPENTQILLQMENKARAAGNYPIGRHSRFVGTIKKKNEWHKVYFTLLDQPDVATSNTAIDQFVFLFASNSFTSDVYHFDNFESLSRTSATDIIDLKTKIYPNPTNDSVTIESEETIKGAEIYDISGRLVSSHLSIDSKVTRLNTSQLKNGVYLLKIFSEKGIGTQKLEVLR